MEKLNADAALRKQLADLLDGGNAHITFAETVKGFPAEHAGTRPHGSPHSAWELLEHLRIAQEDILIFSRSKDYVEKKWPDDYWPPSPAPRSGKEWESSIQSVNEQLKQFLAMLNDERRDLFEPFPWGEGQTLLREALLIADHNSYHLGQLMLLRRMLEHERPQNAR
jgi:uncharacterized damage-inducible protein DinB